jgi:PqqD family protein of HPr-rel-A system
MSTPLTDLMLNDRGFVFDPASGETFQLNATGLRIVRLLQSGLGHDAALAQVISEYDVDEHTAQRDFGDFVENIARMGWRAGA